MGGGREGQSDQHTLESPLKNKRILKFLPALTSNEATRPIMRRRAHVCGLGPPGPRCALGRCTPASPEQERRGEGCACEGSGETSVTGSMCGVAVYAGVYKQVLR